MSTQKQKNAAQERIDEVKPKLALATKLITDLETAKDDLEEFDTINELDDAIEKVAGLVQDIQIEIKAQEAVLGK